MFCYKLFRYKLWQWNCTTVGVSWPVSFHIQPIFISLATISSSLLCTYHPPLPEGTSGKYIQLCMGTYRGIWKNILPPRWGKFTTSLHQKPGALSEEIRLISSCLKSRIYRLIAQKITGLLSSLLMYNMADHIMSGIAGLYMTSWRPCWWSRTKAFLSSGN